MHEWNSLEMGFEKEIEKEVPPFVSNFVENVRTINMNVIFYVDKPGGP